MKKIVALIFVICFTNHLNVKGAETIVTIEGQGEDDLLVEEGLQIIEHSVDWSQVGEYDVKYYNQETMQYEYKNVVVTLEENLEQGISYFSHEQFLYDALALGGLPIDDDHVLVYGGKNDGYYPYQTQNDAHFAYFAVCNKGVIVWEKTINDLFYGAIRHAVKKDNGFVIIGDYDTVNQGRNIFIHEYSLSGQLLFKKELIGYGDDFAHRLTIFQEELYFIASSNSTTNDYQGLSHSENNIVIGRMTKEPERMLSLIGIGNSGVNVFLDVLFTDEAMFLLVNFKKEGYFISLENKYDFVGIVKVDYRLNVHEWHDLENYTLGDKYGLVCFGEEIGLYSYYYQINRANIFVLDLDLNYLRNETIVISEGNYQILDSKMVEEENIFVVFTKVMQEQNVFYFIYLYDHERKLVYYEKLSILDVTQKNIYVGVDEHLNIQLIDKIDGEWIIMTLYSFIKAEVKTISYDHLMIDQLNLWVNGTAIAPLLYKNNIGMNPFGMYTNFNLFSTSNFKVLLPMNYEYYLQTNVRSAEIYDLKTKVYFNGTGYLNQNKINSGYEIPEEGNYVLEVRGNHGEQKVIVFTVSSLSEKNTPLVVDDSFESVQLIDKKEVVHLDNHLVSLVVKPEEKDKIPLAVYLGLSGCLLGVIFGVVYPLQTRKRKIICKQS